MSIFASAELADRVKQLGFNDYCIAIYKGSSENLEMLTNPRRNSDLGSWYTAPTYTQIIDWIYRTTNKKVKLMPLQWETAILDHLSKFKG